MRPRPQTHSSALSWSAARPGSQGAEVGCSAAKLRQGREGRAWAETLQPSPSLRALVKEHGRAPPSDLLMSSLEPTWSWQVDPPLGARPTQTTASLLTGAGGAAVLPRPPPQAPRLHPADRWPLAHRKPCRPTLLGKGLRLVRKVSPGGFTPRPGEDYAASPAVLPRCPLSVPCTPAVVLGTTPSSAESQQG